jgi:hypothetical protein
MRRGSMPRLRTGSHRRKNIEVISKLVRLGQDADADVAEQLISDALENAVSAFDGFGREVCRVADPRSTDPAKASLISFQNIEGARHRVQDLFSVDIASTPTPGEWTHVALCFKKRHVMRTSWVSSTSSMYAQQTIQTRLSATKSR